MVTWIVIEKLQILFERLDTIEQFCQQIIAINGFMIKIRHTNVYHTTKVQLVVM